MDLSKFEVHQQQNDFELNKCPEKIISVKICRWPMKTKLLKILRALDFYCYVDNVHKNSNLLTLEKFLLFCKVCKNKKCCFLVC